jgi:D-inositol-3-phosphate glycosyltransferase
MTLRLSAQSGLTGERSGPGTKSNTFVPGAALLTGGTDPPYMLGLAMALASKGVVLEVIGGDQVDSPELHTTPNLKFLNLRGSNGEEASLASKVRRVLIYYVRLVRYTAVAKPKIFHILWNNRFEFFDRTLLMLYYKLLGKKIVITAHNVNLACNLFSLRSSRSKRVPFGWNDSLLNRLTLRVQYLLAHHIFVHTEEMKHELMRRFGVRESIVSVIPFGINNRVPNTGLTPSQAKQRLGVRDDERTILFFGNIRPYKGLEYLVGAFLQLAATHREYRLIIAGRTIKWTEKYWDQIQATINRHASRGQVIQRIQFIPDEEIELYFKAADVLVLPYTQIYQSGVLFLAYSFGLPVIASDVGSFHHDIIQGKTGYICLPSNAADLANTIETYFESDLFKALDRRRLEIRDYAKARHSWDLVGEMTRDLYAQLEGR